MSTSWFHRVSLASAALLLTGAVQAQSYVGSDNFDSGISAAWDFQYSFTAAAGAFTGTGGQVEFTSPGGDASRVLVWNNDVNPGYTQNWTARLDVAINATPASGYNVIGLQIYSANQQAGFFSILAYSSATQGNNVLFEKGRSTDGTVDTMAFVDYAPDIAVTDLSNLTLLASFDAVTKGVTLTYSFDSGATTGESVTFYPGVVAGDFANDVTAGSWFAEPTDGFSFRLLARSSVDALGAGVVTADNFSVSAVPEPSTYAALAGVLAFGLACWRRRAAAGAQA
jgi:hypothetical protein